MDKKILIVGNFSWYFYEEALIDGFNSIQVNTSKFVLKSTDLRSKLFNFLYLRKTNDNLIKQVTDTNPDAVFFYRTNEIFPSSIKKIKALQPKTKLLFFHNDNPYCGYKHRLKYFLYLRCLKHSDITYVYRPSNIKDAKIYGAKNVKLFYPHYCTKIHLGNIIEAKNKKHDIVFIGHYEKDRASCINYLIKANVKVKVFGPGWMECSRKNKWPFGVVNNPVYGDGYRNTISSSKMALCFLSKINKDVYTRRNFEIPAIGSVVVSEYTKELSDIFKPNKEIILFKNQKDLVAQVKKLLNNEVLINELTKNGYQKIISLGASEYDRAKQILNDIK